MVEVHPRDRVTVVHSPFVWTVKSVLADGRVRCRNCDGRVITFAPDEILAVVS